MHLPPQGRSPNTRGAVPPEQVPGGNSSVNFGDNYFFFKHTKTGNPRGGSFPPPPPPRRLRPCSPAHLLPRAMVPLYPSLGVRMGIHIIYFINKILFLYRTDIKIHHLANFSQLLNIGACLKSASWIDNHPGF